MTFEAEAPCDFAAGLDDESSEPHAERTESTSAMTRKVSGFPWLKILSLIISLPSL